MKPTFVNEAHRLRFLVPVDHTVVGGHSAVDPLANFQRFEMNAFCGFGDTDLITGPCVHRGTPAAWINGRDDTVDIEDRAVAAGGRGG